MAITFFIWVIYIYICVYLTKASCKKETMVSIGQFLHSYAHALVSQSSIGVNGNWITSVRLLTFFGVFYFQIVSR